MIVREPVLADDSFLADVEAARAEPGLHLWWLGQSGFLAQHAGIHVLLDPYLSDSLSEKYAGTATPHERITRRVVAPERLAFVDLVTSSHGHTDHLDAETLRAVLAGGAAFVCAAGTEVLAFERTGRAPDAALAPGDVRDVAGVRLTAVPASHENAPGGAAMGLVLQLGSFAVYHSGDTVVAPGIAETVARHRPAVALLPINGQLGNMDGEGAAELAHAAGAGVVVPCHFGMFRFNTASPDAFVAACTRLVQPYRVLQSGERLTVDP